PDRNGLASGVAVALPGGEPGMSRALKVALARGDGFEQRHPGLAFAGHRHLARRAAAQYDDGREEQPVPYRLAIRLDAVGQVRYPSHDPVAHRSEHVAE